MRLLIDLDVDSAEEAMSILATLLNETDSTPARAFFQIGDGPLMVKTATEGPYVLPDWARKEPADANVS